MVDFIAISSFQAADSPRLEGESEEHARTLAITDSALPPILMHRETMRVIYGMHRLRAAILNGHDQIGVQFFDGSEEDAFVAAVRANIRHNPLLALADREAAAARIVGSHPEWSERAGAEALHRENTAMGNGLPQITGPLYVMFYFRYSPCLPKIRTGVRP